VAAVEQRLQFHEGRRVVVGAALAARAVDSLERVLRDNIEPRAGVVEMARTRGSPERGMVSDQSSAIIGVTETTSRSP
jgi:hypothetical protein